MDRKHRSIPLKPLLARQPCRGKWAWRARPVAKCPIKRTDSHIRLTRDVRHGRVGSACGKGPLSRGEDETSVPENPLPHLTKKAADAIRGERGAEGVDIDQSDRLIAELETADLLVLGVLMYNFTVPSTLKTWIDRVVRARRTFAYEDGQPRELLDLGKKAVLCLSSDGIYPWGPTRPMTFVEPSASSHIGSRCTALCARPRHGCPRISNMPKSVVVPRPSFALAANLAPS